MRGRLTMVLYVGLLPVALVEGATYVATYSLVTLACQTCSTTNIRAAQKSDCSICSLMLFIL